MLQLADARTLLPQLWSIEGWGEFRALGDEKTDRPYWLKLPVRPEHFTVAADWILRRNAAGQNLYFGVNPRRRARGRNEDVTRYTSFVADLDDVEGSWAEVVALAEAGLPPSACVRTRRGVHLYWLLKEPEPADPDGLARSRMQTLQAALGSDPVHDPARILRLPGTVCWKDALQSTMYLAWFDAGRRFSSEEIESVVATVWPDLAQTGIGGQTGGALGPSPSSVPPYPAGFAGLPADLQERASQAWPKGQRSGHCMALIRGCVRLGWTDDRILALLRSLPLGSHYTDRGRGAEAAFDYDVGKARRQFAAEGGRFHELIHARVERVSILEGQTTHLRLALRHLDGANAGLRSYEYLEIGPRSALRWRRLFESAGLAPPDRADRRVYLLEGRSLKLEVAVGHRVRVVRFLAP
jgi:hypothetical protein